MFNINRKSFALPFALFALLLLTTFSVKAQSTIWNTPSTDIQPKKTTYVEFDYLAHFDKAERGGFQTYGVRTVYGVAKNMEVGVNAFYTKAGDEALPVEVQPNFKWRFFENEKHGVSASVGGMYYAPVNHRAGTDAHGIIYGNVSKKINHFYGPRLTTGVYALVGRQQGQGNRKGMTAAFEQPLHRKLSFVADWYSGNNKLGYAGGGLAMTVSKKSLLYVGYNVGNNGRGNNYLGVFYGYTF